LGLIAIYILDLLVHIDMIHENPGACVGDDMCCHLEIVDADPADHCMVHFVNRECICNKAGNQYLHRYVNFSPTDVEFILHSKLSGATISDLAAESTRKRKIDAWPRLKSFLQNTSRPSLRGLWYEAVGKWK
jgi:hypothetical protein